jgi:putative FmdB family regulatory protein
MPIYEYQCEKCKRVLSFLVRNVAAHKPPVCPKCGHPKMSRVLSRFATSRRDGSGGEDDLPDFSDFDERDPRSMARMMRRLADDSGEEMPAEVDEFCRRLESGEDPEKLEKEFEEKFGDEENPGGAAAGGAGDNTLYEA